jgi:hypothetical protein
MEAAGSLKTAFVEAGVADGGDDADGAVRAADGATFSGGDADGDGVAAPAVVVSTWGGESSSMGSVGVALRGDTPSHGDVGIEGGWSEFVVGVLSGVVTCRVADGGVAVRETARFLPHDLEAILICSGVVLSF